MKRFVPVFLALTLSVVFFAQTARPDQLMYVGTLDKNLLVIDEDKEEVVDQISLGGIPRTALLSADQQSIYVLTTQMLLEIVDLKTRKVVSSFSLADARSRPRMQASAPDLIEAGGGRGRYSGLAVDPLGRYLYATMRSVVKDIDQYRVDLPQFVAIDLQEKKIAKSWPFPKDINDGFGFNATYKVSPDGKLLYVFQEDILVFDLDTFQQVELNHLGVHRILNKGLQTDMLLKEILAVMAPLPRRSHSQP